MSTLSIFSTFFDVVPSQEIDRHAVAIAKVHTISVRIVVVSVFIVSGCFVF